MHESDFSEATGRDTTRAPPKSPARDSSGQTVAEHSVVLLGYPNQLGPTRGETPPASRHRKLLWRRSHYSLSPVQRRRNERLRASRRTREPYARLGSRGSWSNAHPAAGCTKSPYVMRISMAPLMLWVERTGSPAGAKGSLSLIVTGPGPLLPPGSRRFQSRALWARPRSPSIWLPESSTGTTSPGNVGIELLNRSSGRDRPLLQRRSRRWPPYFSPVRQHTDKRPPASRPMCKAFEPLGGQR